MRFIEEIAIASLTQKKGPKPPSNELLPRPNRGTRAKDRNELNRHRNGNAPPRTRATRDTKSSASRELSRRKQTSSRTVRKELHKTKASALKRYTWGVSGKQSVKLKSPRSILTPSNSGFQLGGS
jgi:hypothetical protein